jgi:hypothetical protein
LILCVCSASDGLSRYLSASRVYERACASVTDLSVLCHQGVVKSWSASLAKERFFFVTDRAPAHFVSDDYLYCLLKINSRSLSDTLIERQHLVPKLVCFVNEKACLLRHRIVLKAFTKKRSSLATDTGQPR